MLTVLSNGGTKVRSLCTISSYAGMHAWPQTALDLQSWRNCRAHVERTVAGATQSHQTFQITQINNLCVQAGLGQDALELLIGAGVGSAMTRGGAWAGASHWRYHAAPQRDGAGDEPAKPRRRWVFSGGESGGWHDVGS